MDKLIASPNRDYVINNKKAKTSVADVGKAAVVGIYFSAHWCPPCRGFTPELAKIYAQCKAEGKSFEVVFVSSDRDEASFAECVCLFVCLCVCVFVYVNQSLSSFSLLFCFVCLSLRGYFAGIMARCRGWRFPLRIATPKPSFRRNTA